MRALLDTHTFLWAIAEEHRLSRRAAQIYTGPNQLFLSAASVWEIIIKSQAGKLPVPQPSGPYVVRMLASSRIEVLPIKLDHVLRVENLSSYHRDPFDRILVAQSMEEKLPLVTADPLFDRYPVRVIW
jgi:PIN domain nuclease of toxin-antitoxin system